MADEERRGKVPGRWRRYLKRAVLALLAVVVGVPILAVGLLHTSFVQKKIEARIEARAAERLNGSLDIGNLSFSLFSDHNLVLSNVRLTDASGREAVAIDTVDVGLDLWKAATSKGLEIDVSSVVVDGVRVHIVKAEDGSSNLSNLVKPPEVPEPPPEEKAPKDRHIQIRSLALSRVELTLERPDGTIVRLRDAGLDASVDARPARKDVTLELPSLRAELSVDKPNLKLEVKGFRSGLGVDLKAGAGKVSLAPTKAEIALAIEGAPVRTIPLDLEGIDLDVAEGQLGVQLDQLLAGALALEALEIEGRLGPEGPEGEQRAELLGLNVDAAKLNALVGKDILRSDLDLGLSLSGPPAAVDVKGELKATGAHLLVTGTVDAEAEHGPGLDMVLTLEDVDTKELLALETVPPVLLERLQVTAKGKPNKTIDVDVDLDKLVLRGKLIDTLTVDATVEDKKVITLDRVQAEAYGQRLVSHGTVDLKKREVDVTATVDADVGNLLRRLQAAGMKVKAPVPEKALTLDEGVVVARVKGPLDGELDASLDIHGMRVAGGRVYADVDAKVKRQPKGSPKPVTLEDLDGHLEIKGVYLDPLLAWRGKQLKGLTAAVWADLRVHGPEEPGLKGEVIVRAQTQDLPALDPDLPLLTLRTRIDGVPEQAQLRVDLVGTDGLMPEATKLVKIRARVPLDPEKKKLALRSPWSVDLKLGAFSLPQLRTFLPKKIGDKLPRQGTVKGGVKLRGSAARPRGIAAIDVEGGLLPSREQRIKLRTKIHTDAKGRVIASNRLKLWHDTKDDPLLVGKVVLGLTRSPLVPGPKPDLAWKVDVGIPDRDLSTLPFLSLAGQGDIRITGKGDRRDIDRLAVTVDLDDFVGFDRGPIDAALKLAVDDEKTTLDLSAALENVPVLKGEGSLGRGGKGLLTALRRKDTDSIVDKLGDPDVKLDLTVIEQAPGTFAAALPASGALDACGEEKPSRRETLRRLPGMLGGAIHVKGKLSEPLLDGGLAYHGFETISGRDGRVAIALDGGPERVGADVAIGAQQDVSVSVSVPRQDIKPYLVAKKCTPKPCQQDVVLPLTATVRSKKTDLAHLLPKIDLAGKPLSAGGSFAWTLDGSLVLQANPGVDEDGKRASVLSAEESSLSGELTLIDGHVDLPGTLTSQGRRRYERIGLRMLQSLEAIELTRLELHESDLEKKDRSVVVSAKIGLEKLKPAGLSAKLEMDDWLLFGDGSEPGARVGPIDAPRGALDATIAVSGALGGDVKDIDVDVQQLDLSVPYRYNRSHWPEVTHLGDVTFLDKGMSAAAKAKTIGKLPTPPEAPPATCKAKGGSDLNVDVTFSRRAHLQLQQLDLVTDGTIAYRKRNGDKSIEGKLTMHGGYVYLGGKDHKLIEGSIAFDEDNPGGYADLLFGRREHNATLRDISKASAGRVVKIHIEGPLSDRKTTLSGAGSPGTLYDLLSVHNAGRPRYTSHPDLPAAMSTQFPQFNNLLMLSFFSVNVPGVLLMDKVAGWGDPYDDRSTKSYGQLQHYEAEGYAEDGSFRVRVVKNPPRAGQSDAEVTVDVLFNNTAQSVFGVGLGGGSRGGGGPGIFFEWSSED